MEPKIVKIQSAGEFLAEQKEYLEARGYKDDALLDALTPIFLSVMQKLPPTAQSIVHYLCLTKKDLSDFLTIDFLSKKLREHSKVVSVYCALLFKYRLVARQKKGRGYEYKMSDDFFVEWYRFRYGKYKMQEKRVR